MVKEYKPSEEVEGKDGYVRDYISGSWIKTTKEELDATQVFSKRLVEDYGYDKKQIQTRPQFRVRKHPSDEKKTWPVDIAVFNDERRTEDNLFMIVECKAKDKRSGRRQLETYMEHSPALVGVLFNGEEHLYTHKVVQPDGRVLYPELPNIPNKGQRIEDIGLFKRKDLKPTHNLKVVFKDIRNHLAGMTTGITRDEALAQEIINILFCKIYDEKNKAPEEIVDFRYGVNEDKSEVKRRIQELFNEKVKDPEEYGDVFSEKDVITLDADSLAYVVGELQKYCITEAERDVVGDAFEVFIGPALRGGEGQFFTPRNIVRMVVEMLDPEHSDYIIDPACGSGGFLIVTLEHVWKKIEDEGKKRRMSKEWVRAKQRKIASQYFMGIDKDSFLSKVTKAYMAIVGDGRGGIFCENSLERPEKWNSKTREKIKLGRFNVLMTNPPFGSKIPIKGDQVLGQYDLGFEWKKDKTGEWNKTSKLQDKQPPQIIFIERCLQLLDEGGRMGIVLPDGILGNVNDGYIRKVILQQAKILAVVDCPKETFAPRPQTKTSILVLQKKKRGEEITNYPIFMVVAEKCGHDRRGRETRENDLPLVSIQFKKWRELNNVTF